MTNITQHIRQMLIGNLASAASHIGGLDETEARDWAKTQSEKILKSGEQDFDSLEQLIFSREKAELHWLKTLLG